MPEGVRGTRQTDGVIGDFRSDSVQMRQKVGVDAD